MKEKINKNLPHYISYLMIILVASFCGYIMTDLISNDGHAKIIFAKSSSYSRCSLVYTGFIPLNDLGTGLYKGFIGGLYPNGQNPKPNTVSSAALNVSSQIIPLNSSGVSDSANGKIVMVSIGMSNTSDEFATGGSVSFKPRADADLSKNPKLILVNGAAYSQPAQNWTSPTSSNWSNLNSSVYSAGATAAQVQVAWVELVLVNPAYYGPFPQSAKVLQDDLQIIVRNLKAKYPNVKIVYFSNVTRMWSTQGISPEPYAYESAFAIKWMIENQMNGLGNLNYIPTNGTVVAPLILWGPYLWADGDTVRSDGMNWPVTDVKDDCTHNTPSGIFKVSSELLAFFKNDPSAATWFLKAPQAGQAPTITASADVTSGTAPLIVNFNSQATPVSGTINEYLWSFDDGDYATVINPVKIFPAPGIYHVHVTAKDTSGNSAAATVTVTVN